MKTFLVAVAVVVMGFATTESARAQPFYQYQTIGKHTFHVSVVWQNGPWVGIGYSVRSFGKTFTDWQAEWRFPVQSIYDLDNHELIAGFYRPLRLRKSFVAMGLHAKMKKSTEGMRISKQYSAALTLLPSYVYTSSLSDGPYGTVGGRITYNPILLAKVEDTSTGVVTSQTLAGHNIQVGAHFDVHLQRTLGISTNAFYERVFKPVSEVLDVDSDEWSRAWDVNLGTTYWLQRWGR